MKKQPQIWLNGELIDVSEEVFKVHKKSERKCRYFSEDLKVERIVVNQEKEKVDIVKSREDSYDRLVDENSQQFAYEGESVEERAEKNNQLEKLRRILPTLPSGEQLIIDGLYFKFMTERKLSEETGIPQKTINNRKHKILAKLKKLLEN